MQFHCWIVSHDASVSFQIDLGEKKNFVTPDWFEYKELYIINKQLEM